MKKLTLISILFVFVAACNTGTSDKSEKPNTIVYDEEEEGEKIPTPGGEGPEYDPNRGLGKFTTVDVGNKLDMALGK